MIEYCPNCKHLQKNCGGHWSRPPRSATTNPDHRRGRVNLDIIDGYGHFRADNDDFEYDTPDDQ